MIELLKSEFDPHSQKSSEEGAFAKFFKKKVPVNKKNESEIPSRLCRRDYD